MRKIEILISLNFGAKNTFLTIFGVKIVISDFSCQNENEFLSSLDFRAKNTKKIEILMSLNFGAKNHSFGVKIVMSDFSCQN